MKKARDIREPLFLDLPERKIVLNPDGTVDRVFVPERLEAHRLIEEFMILANVAAAESLEQAGSDLIYRVHDEPSLEKMRALSEVLGLHRPEGPEPGRAQAGAVQPHPAQRRRIRSTSSSSTRWCCARSRRPSTRLRITAISA